MAGAPAEQPIFYYDLSSPEAYLVAERSAAVLGEVPEWQPVRLAGLRGGEVGPFRCAAEIDAYQEDIGRRAAAYRLQPLRWPAEFPSDPEWALLVATYAKQIGRAVAANPEIEELVTRIEAEQVDLLTAEGEELPSADSIAREFQRFLRQRGDQH